MTKDKDVKVLIVLISVFVIISLIGLSFQIKSKADNLTNSYNARKEDLQLKQAELEKAVLTLNNTLQKEQLVQQKLSDEIASLKNQTATGPSKTPTPAPKPKPTPAPVTRAS